MDLRGKLQRWGPAWAAREGHRLNPQEPDLPTTSASPPSAPVPVPVPKPASVPSGALGEMSPADENADADADETADADAVAVTATSEPSVASVASVGAGISPPLALLRERMFEVLARSGARTNPTARAPQPEGDLPELTGGPLPFAVVETEQGARWVRSETYGSDYAVGRHRVGAMAHEMAGSADILAALALDRSLADVDPQGALFFDVETTGLAGGTGTVAFLIGLAWFEDDGLGGRQLAFEQLLLPEYGRETPMLEQLCWRMAKATLLVSFNGKSFDLPLLRTRCVLSRVLPGVAPPHFDLLHVARRVHRLKSKAISRSDEAETSCRLMALERKILGLVRDDDLPSAEVPSRYRHWLRLRDLRVLTSVCEHNRWDVLAMAGLMARYVEGVRALAGDHPWSARDLVGLARTLRRAGEVKQARQATDTARLAAAQSRWDPELDVALHHERGQLAKRRGDLATAIDSFAHLAQKHDDRAARLELSKLYEHRLNQPEHALHLARQGVDEDAEALRRRIERLERKATRPRQLSLYEDDSTAEGSRTRVGRQS